MGNLYIRRRFLPLGLLPPCKEAIPAAPAPNSRRGQNSLSLKQVARVISFRLALPLLKRWQRPLPSKIFCASKTFLRILKSFFHRILQAIIFRLWQKQRHALDVSRLREHIDRLHLNGMIALFHQSFGITRQGG